MLRLHHAQRRHIITSLETLLYQLHTLSFFLSPSLLVLIPRCSAQFQFSRPREIDPKRTLRFWFFMVMVFNIGSLWSHATDGAAKGPSLILDFIGMPYVPSQFHVLSLDLFIIFLEMVLTTIAYETSLATATSGTDIADTLMYIPESSDPQSSANQAKVENTSTTQLPYVLDLRFGTIIKRLRAPAPLVPRTSGRDELLPLPNTMPAELRESLRILLRARAEMRARAEQAEQEIPAEGRPRRVPGAMDADDNE